MYFKSSEHLEKNDQSNHVTLYYARNPPFDFLSINYDEVRNDEKIRQIKKIFYKIGIKTCK